MRAKDFITELFQPGQDINFKWSRPFKDEVNVLGKTPQGHELSINFWEITDDIVAIDFTIDADVEQDPDPDTSPKSGHELTRHGEEFAVFTQVVNAITQYLNKLPKNNVFFQVKRTEAQREPLYLKIANRVAKQLGFRQGTEQELEATNPGLYNKFDNRYSKLLWYTNTPQGVAEEIQGIAEGDNNDTAISLSKLGKFHPGADTLAEFVPERATAQYALHPDKWESTFYSLTNKDSDKLKYYGPKKISIPPGTLVGDMAIANKFYRAKTAEEKQQYAELYRQSLKPYPVDVSEYRMPELLIPQPGIAENFADGRKFVEPNFDFEWEEAERYPEFVKLGKDAWIELARKGKAVTINSAQGINNTDAADPDSFKSLVPAKQKRALAQLEKGTVEMPIVAVYSDGHKELVGGNTRLTAMMARDGKATIWAFRVPGKQGVAEGESNNTPSIGINVRSDGDIDYASLIVDGKKKYESRKTDSLGPYVGKTVGIVRTGSGPAVAIGQVTIGEPIVVNAEKFNKLRNQHLVPQGSKFDIDVGGIKYLYPMIDPVRWANERLIKHRGIVSRKIQEQGMAEAFNQPYSADLSDESEHGDYDSLTQLPDGSYLTVMFNYLDDGEYQVEFWRGPSQGVTGEGDSQRIFATVLSTIQKFIKKHKPQQLTFSASKDVEPGQNSESRAKLYNRLVDRYAAAWGYNALINDYGDQVGYQLTRLKPNVAENFKDGKNPGRKGLSKRMGVNTKASVSALRKVAKNSSGEKQRMAHWLANMKSGRKKS